MYDPKFTQKQMYDQYGSSRETTKNVTKSTRSSGYSGNNPNEDAAVTRGIGAKPPSFGGGQDNNPNRDEYENKPTVAKVYEKTVDLFKSFGAKEPEALIVDGKRVYQGPLFSGYDPTVRIGPFGGDAGKKQYRLGMPILGEVSPSYPSPTLPSGDNNPALNMFGVRRGFTRGTDMPELPTSTDVPANMDPKTRALSQGILPIPDEPTAPYTIRSGDTLSDIAKMTGTTVEELADINNIEKVDEIDAGVVIDIPIRRKPSGLGTNPTSTEFMDAATKEMLEDMTPVKAGFWDFLFGKKEPQKFEITVDEIKEYAKENFDPVQAAAFVATFEAETGSGKDLVENGYGKKDAVRVFVEANRRKDGTLSAAMKERKKKIEKAKDSEEIFNIVYGNRLGNTSSGDGFTYRGRGPIMLTGKENYKKVGDAIGVDLVKNPDLLITDKNVALKATMAYLQQKKFNSVSSASELAAVVGHSNPKGKEGIRRWNKASKIYEEMYGTIMPTKKPKQRPEGFKGIVINEDTNPSTSLRPKARPLGRP
jgi:putative chitinase